MEGNLVKIPKLYVYVRAIRQFNCQTFTNIYHETYWFWSAEFSPVTNDFELLLLFPLDLITNSRFFFIFVNFCVICYKNLILRLGWFEIAEIVSQMLCF